MRYIIFLITILASVGFFNYHGMFSVQIQRLLFYLTVVGGLAYTLYDGHSLKDVKYPRMAYFYVLFGIGFSVVMASTVHMQSLSTSIMSTAQYFLSYLFLIVMLKIDLPPEKIIKTYIVLSAVSGVVYFCNVSTMPFNMFGSEIKEDLSRGILRIPVVFIEIFPLLVFYGINRWLDTKEKKWIVLIAYCTLMIFLSVIRQIIAVTGVLGVLFLFRKMSVMKKVMLIALVGVVVLVVLPEIPMYKVMIELSEDQRDQNDEEEDIRIQSWRFYTYENQDTWLTPIFGNGVPSISHSIWGTIFDSESETSGRFTHDVGWAGFFWFFGILTTIALLVLLVKTIIINKSPQMQYLNYWLVFIIITSIASAPILYFYQIVNLMVGLSIVYNASSSTVAEEAHVQPEPKEQPLLHRYPQLSRISEARERMKAKFHSPTTKR